MAEENLAGRTCLVTGATSGVGEETAVGLARCGARVILVARSRERGEASAARVKAKTGNAGVEVLLADLASQEQIRELAGQVRERCPALHVLVNNAAVFHLSRETTADGLFSLTSARCIGSCGLAPVAVLDGKVRGKETSEGLLQHVKEVVALSKEKLTEGGD